MLTFGLSTLNDLLSWTIALTLGSKLLATIVLLPQNKEVWDRPGWGARLWWLTKITPLIAVPCFIYLAWLQGLSDITWFCLVMMLFVVIAVPLKVRQRRNRIAKRVATNRIG